MSKRALEYEPLPHIIRKSPDPLFGLDIDVVTPMFGGSAEPKVADAANPVSGKSIRGHLRFWWRACRAPKFKTASDLYNAESAIWGSTDAPSAVDVRVEALSCGKEVACAEFEGNSNGPGVRNFSKFRSDYPPYALFPFQGKASRGEIEEPPAKALEGVRFRLTISSGRGGAVTAGLEEDVEAALWAWMLFGGVGSRTRRGCGSLWTPDLRFQYAPTELAKIAARHAAAGLCSYGVPILSGARLLVRKPPDKPPMQAWRAAVERYRDFRQREGFARNPGQQPSRPGRSRWPEPDSIRDRADRWDESHKPANPARPYYPRADLGLPIVFHFQSRFDPDKSLTLEAKGDKATRMASPVIVKSLAVQQNVATPMILILNAPHVWDEVSGGVGFGAGPNLSECELKDPGKSALVRPLQDCGGAVTCRDALAAFAKKDPNWIEVKL